MHNKRSLRFFSRLLQGSQSSIGPALSLIRCIARITRSHDGCGQGSSTDQQTDAAKDHLPQSPKSAVVGSIRRFPLSAKIGSAIFLIGLATHIWFIGADCSQRREWTTFLLGHLVVGQTSMLRGASFLGLSGSHEKPESCKNNVLITSKHWSNNTAVDFLRKACL